MFRDLTILFALLTFLSFPLSFQTHAAVIEFNHTLRSDYSVEELWDEFHKAMIDSKASAIWPSASQVVGEGLVHNGVIDVTYSMGLFSPTYRYLLTVEKEKYQFSYEAIGKEHPFVGGATITLFERPQGSVLEWLGSYDTAGAGFFARRAFLNFERRFFQQLKLKLKP